MTPVRVHHLASPLGAGILRAVLYDDSPAWENCEDLYGPEMMELAKQELRKRFKKDNHGTFIQDCRCPDWGDLVAQALTICLCDRHCRRPVLPTGAPRRDAHKGQTLFPAFPHRWGMVSPKWEPKPRKWSAKPSVGFCGVANRPPVREEAVRQLNEGHAHVTPRVIPRRMFMGGETDRKSSRREFMELLTESDYTLCVRGVGNWDYRFYETLCAGRVPVLVDTNRALPDGVDWQRQAVLIPENAVAELPLRVLQWHEANRKRWAEVQMENRRIWLEKLSPVGWWKEWPHHGNR